ncbi:hypothetical protein [Nonomuraea sp. NPDC050786]|uniref:hypothetical protein n=1 Tax=Nonomuraea sp. NPDC050786 TaxID=3154840 RepID=UPI0033C150D7
MGVRRAPLLLAVALAALTVAAGPAAADRGPWPHPVPRVSVRPPAPPKGVTVGPTVSVPRVRTWRKPVPGVSISMPPGRRRAAPAVTVPHVTIYPGGVCAGRVQVGECSRRVPHQVRRPVPRTTPVRAPAPVPTPKVTPRVTPRAPVRQVAAAPSRRRSPIATVLVMTVLVSAITATTAVAFRARR